MDDFNAISQRFLTRRRLLALGSAAGAAALLPVSLHATAVSPGFNPVQLGSRDTDAVAPGYTASVLIAWGDGLDGSASPHFPLTAGEQKARFGYNNDFIAYTPLDGSRRGLLGINHEYPMGHLMFPGYTSRSAARRGVSAPQVACEMAAVGHSVIEVERTAAGWRVVADSAYRRRFDAATAVNFDGPARGHAGLRTAADPQGVTVRGILGCCAGGKTPWGTVLIGEENVGDFFTGSTAGQSNLLTQTNAEETYPRWAEYDERFHAGRHPNELNRFGWIVEYDPRNPASAPVKHTALGRFEHEGATVACRAGKPLVVYSGDDSENQFIYRYVSTADYLPEQGAANTALLSAGTLYCARFRDDGSGEWLPMRQGEGPLTPANGFASAGDVLIHARRAAALVGATPMDRPEDIEVSPVSGRVYVALTKNKNKPGPNAVNPRARNAAGHVLEIIPPTDREGSLHWEDQFRWDLLMQCGDPRGAGDERGVYGTATLRSAWLANPDNLAFDKRGRLWIATDGMNDFGARDGLWCCAVDGDERAVPLHFYSGPRGAEICGPEFTPDGETLFVSVQHPGDEEGSHFGAPSTRWPDFRAAVPPRPGVIAITRDRGGLIGD